MDTSHKGARNEEYTADYLRQNGFRILEQNFRCKLGEIDIIASKGRVIHIIEVKYRSNYRYGSPLSAVDYRKRKRVSNAASYYMYCRRLPTDTPISFDVAAVSDRSIELYENVFEYLGRYR